MIFHGRSFPVLYSMRSFRGRVEHPTFPKDLWPASIEIDPFVLHNETWRIPGWNIAISEWSSGDSWRRLVRATFEPLIAQDGHVTWIGGEGLVVDPPTSSFLLR
jgi:hypothetical protein